MAELNSTFGVLRTWVWTCAMALATAGVCAAAAAPAPATRFDYELAPVVEHGTTAFVITLRFVGPASGSLTLDLPNEGEGERERWRFLSDFAVTGATMAAPNPATRVLTFTPGAAV